MMKNRCVNPRSMDYAYYGGRGIFIPSAWFEYNNFLADMGERPAELTLERVHGDAWYSKANCIWASRLDQARNREYTLDLEFDGRTRKVWEWAEELNIKPMTIHLRLWQAKVGQISRARVFEPNRRK